MKMHNMEVGSRGISMINDAKDLQVHILKKSCCCWFLQSWLDPRRNASGGFMFFWRKFCMVINDHNYCQDDPKILRHA